LARTLRAALSTTHCRHCYFADSAGAARGFRAIVKSKILAETHTYFRESLAIAGNGHRRARKTWIGFDESFSHFCG
jgi:hypothetical protein